MINNDHKLMGRIQGRDEAAFEQIVTRYDAPLRRHLLGMVRDEDDAKDIVQEVFLRVWTRSEQWEGRGGVRPWLFRVATNLALNHLRSVRRRRETPLAPPPANEDDPDQPAEWTVDSGAESPEQAVSRRESARRLYGMVGDLSEEKREVWALVYEEEMDMARVAERLGIPTGTVKSRLYHARQQLAREWNEMVKEWEDV